MTKTNKPGIKADPEGQSPEEVLALKLALREAEKRAAEEKRRADEAEARYKNNSAASKPADKPATPRAPLKFSHNLRFGSALRWAFLGGAVGLTWYAGRELASPAKSLFMAGPNFLRDKMGGLKGTVSAIALASAQVLGLGAGAVEAFDYVKDATAFESSHTTMAARGGLVGFGVNQLIRTSATVKAERTVRQPLFDTITNHTLNGGAQVLSKIADGLAALDQDNRPASLSTRFVQICAPLLIDAKGQVMRPAQASESLRNAVQGHYANIGNTVNAMKSDKKSSLNNILLEKKQNVQLIIPAYNEAAKGIQVKAVENPRELQCPGQNYLQTSYRAEEWLYHLGLRPQGIDPVR